MADGTSSGRWYAASDLVGTQGIPGTAWGISKAAEREGWDRRPRQRGKGWEYAVGSLPIATQIAVNQAFAIGEIDRLKSHMTLIEQQIGELLQLRGRIRRRLRGVK